MKNFILILFVFITIATQAQVKNVQEKVDWETPQTYTVKSFTFKSDKFNYGCEDCKVLALKTNQGIMGYYVVGEGWYTTVSNKDKRMAGAVLFKFNPADKDKLLTQTNPVDFEDENFTKSSVAILKSTAFRRSYHKNMDAYIPSIGDFSVVLFTEEGREILISVSKTMKQVLYYDFSSRKKLSKY